MKIKFSLVNKRRLRKYLIWRNNFKLNLISQLICRGTSISLRTFQKIKGTIPRRRSLENPVTIEFTAFQSERKCKAPVSKPEKGLAGLKSLRKDNSKPILTPIMLPKPTPINLK
ncbi:unnamed protein product [Moneuplotes crassus]|uniref:Uncharacterized protein n=1 Tax=Euplotes crassus TaxID=5936 RepID=A0AAD1U4T8_EUPCR|nr:unnamed protein product [Moneuplotes crassus]